MKYYFNGDSKGNSIYTPGSDNAKLAGGTVYVFLYDSSKVKGSDVANQLKTAFAATYNPNLGELLGDYSSLVSFESRALASNKGRFEDNYGPSSNGISIDSTGYNTAFAFVVTAAENVGGEEGKYALGQLNISSGGDAAVTADSYYTAIDTSKVLRAKMLNAAGAAGWSVSAVPEPTSGLLLLLGVAGLALRRKRA